MRGPGLLPAAVSSRDGKEAAARVWVAGDASQRAAAVLTLLTGHPQPLDLDPTSGPARTAWTLANADGPLREEGILLVPGRYADEPGDGFTLCLAAAVLAWSAGGTADLSGPRVPEGVPFAESAGALLSAAERIVARHGATVLQSFTPPDAAPLHAAYRAAGFADLGAFLALNHPLLGFTPADHAADPFDERVPLTAATHARFAAVYERTYEGSADVILGGQADPARDFAAHLEGGSPDLCTLFVVDGRDAGLVLARRIGANPQEPDPGRLWGLDYLGLVPVARGRGLGRAMLEDLLTKAKEEEAGGVECEVADANAPARRLYEAAGFAEQTRSVLFAKDLPAASPAKA